jgi:MFS family permease
MGLLLSAFLWAYAFSQLPGGALTDRDKMLSGSRILPAYPSEDLSTRLGRLSAL